MLQFMQSQAAFAYASRAAARPQMVSPRDLNLSGPIRRCPVEFEDDMAGAEPTPVDL